MLSKLNDLLRLEFLTHFYALYIIYNCFIKSTIGKAENNCNIVWRNFTIKPIISF